MDRMYERCCGLGVQIAFRRRRMPSFRDWKLRPVYLPSARRLRIPRSMVECTFAEGLQTRLPTMEPRRVSAAKGLIRMRPRSNTYAVTSHGIWVAIFYTNVYGASSDHC